MSLGPTLLFDKSALEALNPDEATWLDHFFSANITPLFFTETLADLTKEMRHGRTPEQVVGNLAYKTPDMGSVPNVHHDDLIAGELMGYNRVDMSGRPIIAGGQTVELGNKTGIVFQQSPEQEAFHRWQRHEFLDVERLIAKSWREALSNIDFEKKYKLFQHFFWGRQKPKTLEEVKQLVDDVINLTDREQLLRFGLLLQEVPPRSQMFVLGRWLLAGRPALGDFAPYFLHVLSVDLFFYIALAADLISRARPSHKIDIAYVYYLPFCEIFTSSDRLHTQVVPFFLRKDQSFVTGTELKADLSKLDAHYSSFSDEAKARGLFSLAPYPPTEGDFLVSQLWDRRSLRWRQYQAEEANKGPRDNEIDKQILEQMRREMQESTPTARQVDSDKVDYMGLSRMVLGRKGKWQRLPPEVLQPRRSDEGNKAA